MQVRGPRSVLPGAVFLACLALAVSAGGSPPDPAIRTSPARLAGAEMSPPPTGQANGAGLSGPILVVTDSTASPSLLQTGETSPICSAVLATEGISGCGSVDVVRIGRGLSLARYRLIVLAAGTRPTGAQVRRIRNWVSRGNHLIAMRPGSGLHALGGLLGLGLPARSLNGGYYRLDVSRPPGRGLESTSMQFHGAADVYPTTALARGVRTVARLYGSATEPLDAPAITSRRVGRGTAVSYAFDPVQSVFLLRNGDPELVGEPTTSTDHLPRLSDRFGDGYLDLAKAGIPQADQLMHVLANQLVEATGTPRAWYLPTQVTSSRPDGFLPAAVVLTGDDHDVISQTVARFQRLKAADPPGCTVAGWTCPRATAYAFTGALDDAAAADLVAAGFELQPHISAERDCPAATGPANETSDLADRDVADFNSAYPLSAAAGSGRARTERWHCYGIWRTYSSIPLADQQEGISADDGSTCWPPQVFDQPQCLLIGSALPMQFPADAGAGAVLDVTQYSVEVTDENPHLVTPAAVRDLLDRAVGPAGYFGYYVVLAHLDNGRESLPLEQLVLAEARRHDLPVISQQQAETFWRARAGAGVTGLERSSQSTTFTLRSAPGRLELMIPARIGDRRVRRITRDGRAVRFSVRTIEGIDYALVPGAVDGRYLAMP